MEFGNRLYELRKQRGFSQEELAGRLEVTRQTVSKWELGDSTPDMEKLVSLGELFEISLDELVLGKKPSCAEHDAPAQKLLTHENREKVKKAAKFALVIGGAVIAVDALSFLVYFLIWGFPC